MGTQRETREWKGKCKLNLAGGVSFDGIAEILEVRFDDQLMAWFGRVKLGTGAPSLVDIMKISVREVIGLKLADGRGGSAMLTSTHYTDAGNDPGAFIYISGISGELKKAGT